MSNMNSYFSLFEDDDFETFGPTCHLCFKEYSSADALDFHIRNFCEYRQPHQQTAKAQPRQAQRSNSGVENAAASSSESLNAQNKCSHCFKTFVTSSSLEAHRRNEICSSHICQNCNRTFHIRTMLITHCQNQVCIPSADRPYACNYCPSYFRSRGNLTVHRQGMHEGFKKARGD
ncbi:hypothetical protein BDZ45DRAFT_748497 [Acephala macrosclerotiorum]|nr:hypothetical protein BDZ45DRAFT_748497 [Acephala macrosclerotiorum]